MVLFAQVEKVSVFVPPPEKWFIFAEKLISFFQLLFGKMTTIYWKICVFERNLKVKFTGFPEFLTSYKPKSHEFHHFNAPRDTFFFVFFRPKEGIVGQHGAYRDFMPMIAVCARMTGRKHLCTSYARICTENTLKSAYDTVYPCTGPPRPDTPDMAPGHGYGPKHLPTGVEAKTRGWP